MLRSPGYTLITATITLMLIGCQDANAPDDAPSALRTPMMSRGTDVAASLR